MNVIGLATSFKGITTPDVKQSVKRQIYIESMVPLALPLGMGLGPIFERHNAFQWDFPTAAAS